ncbi:MAG: hypothetical protein ACOCUH_04370, partial [Bacteriovoracia bacterium]
DPKLVDENRYRRLVNLLNEPSSYFYDHTPLSNIDWNNIDKIVIDSRRNPQFTLVPTNLTTIPSVWKGLSYYAAAFDTYRNNLVNLNFEKVFSKVGKTIGKQIAQIQIFKNEKPWRVLKLYDKFQNVEGRFFSWEDHSYIYELNSLSTKIFFQDKQNFWDKAPRWPVENKPMEAKKWQFIFPKDKKLVLWANFQNGWQLHVITPKNVNRKMRKKVFTNLLEMIIGVGDFHQAFRVTKMNSNKKEQWENELSLNVLYGDRIFVLRQQGDEYLLWDKRTDLIFHHLVKKGELGLQWEEYFEEKE